MDNIDVYVSTTSYTTVAQVTATGAAVLIGGGSNLDPSIASEANWNITTGFGIAGTDSVPEGAYFVYAVADNSNSSTFDELVTAHGKVTVAHNSYFTTANVTVTATGDSGVTAATPGVVKSIGQATM